MRYHCVTDNPTYKGQRDVPLPSAPQQQETGAQKACTGFCSPKKICLCVRACVLSPLNHYISTHQIKPLERTVSVCTVADVYFRANSQCRSITWTFPHILAIFTKKIKDNKIYPSRKGTYSDFHLQ